jgi:hypothetical protein
MAYPIRWLSATRVVALSGVLAAACGRGQTSDEDDLRALLDDGELGSMLGSAQVMVPPDASPGSGGGGGGGSGGRGGGPPDASPGAPDAGCAPSDPKQPPPVDAGSVPCQPPPPLPPEPLGNWRLDDCNPDRTDLVDNGPQGFPAFRSVNVTCVPGAEGQGVSFPHKKDIVYVPDQPQFTFDAGVTVAAWINVRKRGGTATIFRKRDGDTSSFALLLVGDQLTFVIDRQKGGPAAVYAKAVFGRFVHVAATYDGTFLRLFVDGRQVASTRAPGKIEGGEGALLIGNDGNQRRFEGTLDEVWFESQPITDERLHELQCLHRPFELTGEPAVAMSVPPGTPVAFQLTVTNHNALACDTAVPSLFPTSSLPPGFRLSGTFESLPVESGKTVTATVTVTSSDDSDSGEFPFTFAAVQFGDRVTEPPFATVTYVVSAEGCRVSTRKELMITALSVVDDPVRTTFLEPQDPRSGAFTFKRLMEDMAPSPEEAPAMVEAMFRTFTVSQTINTFTVGPRVGFQPLLDTWPRKDGALDLAAAPLALQAIVNRIDLRNLDRGHAGEGRFVFSFVTELRFPLQATLIFEYHLPARTEADVRDWANSWHALGALPFPSEEYNAALEALTRRFSGRNASPGSPNGSALAQIRTNEIAFGGPEPWQFREFVLDDAGRLAPAPIKLTPDRPTFNGSASLAAFVNANEADILADRHDVPLSFQGAPFLAGAVFNDLNGWQAPGILNPEARFRFSLNTCNGCHSAAETGTGFLQISGHFPGSEARLSGFLTGITIFDRSSGRPRELNDLKRRNADLRPMVCPPDQQPPPLMMLPPPRDAGPAASAPPRRLRPEPNFRFGIGRVH